MKKGIKRVLCLLCAMLMLVFAMTACGGSQDREVVSSTTSGDGSSNTVVPPTVSYDENFKDFDPYAGAAGLKGTTVRFATWIDHTETEGATPLANFESDTGLKVELYTVKHVGYVNTLMTKMASGDIPDVFVSNEAGTCFPNTIQIAAPINKVSTVNLKEPIWDQSMLATGTINGDIYLVNTKGTPWSGSNMVFYNKPLFADNGFKTPEEYYAEGKWTWDNLLKCAKEIKALGDDYKGIMLESDILTDSLGTSFIKYDYKTNQFSSGINDKALLEGYQWYAEAKEQGLVDVVLGDFAAFTSNKCGLVVRGPYGLKTTGYFMDMNPEDVGYTYLPSMEEGGTARISSIYRMYGICDKAPNADAAGYFLRYWLDPANYDLDHTFVTVDAGNFYYNLINTEADQKYFCFDKACMELIGGSHEDIWGPALAAAPAGVKTALDSVSNTVDRAVAAANKLIQDKIEADRDAYK